MDWTVRPADIEDADKLALIGAATFLETFAGLLDGKAIVDHCKREHSATAYQRDLAAGGHAWLVEANPGQSPVGFSLLGGTNLPGSVSDGSDIELKRIYTLSKFHGTGVGTALMQRAIDYGEQGGFKRLLLGVYAGNDRALAFYAKKGFAKIADRQFRVGDRDYNDVVLARPLISSPDSTPSLRGE